MTLENMKALCNEYKELQRMKEDLQAEMDSIAEQIKAAMNGAETITAGPYKVSYKTVTSARIDTTALKKELPDVASRFTKTTTARRFLVA